MFGIIVITTSLIATGLLSIIREFQQANIFVTSEDLVFAQKVRANVPTNSLLLTSDQHNHPVSILTGRPIVMGYRGWLWTYGIDYREVERDIATIYAGGQEARPLLEKYGISHIVVGPPEFAQYSVNASFLQEAFPVVVETDQWIVYSVK